MKKVEIKQHFVYNNSDIGIYTLGACQLFGCPVHKRNEERYGETANVQNFRGKRTHYQYLFDGSGSAACGKELSAGAVCDRKDG